jgi:GNAT superfamily N-acetyltransferase
VITRPATLEPAADLAEHYVSTRCTAYPPFYPAETLAAMSVPHETERWRIRIADPAWQTILALTPKAPLAGFVHYRHNDTMEAGTGEIEFLYVGTQHEGAGFGKHLIELAEAGLAAMTFTTATLCVYEGNTHARAFCARRGWSPDGVRRESGSAPGHHLLRYAKSLLSPLSEIGEGVRG